MPNTGSPLVHEPFDGADRVVAGFRVAWAVRQENTVRFVGKRLVHRRHRRNDGHPAPAGCEQPQDVALDAEVVGHHVEPGGIRRAVTLAKAPGPLAPLFRLDPGDDLCQVHPFEAGKIPCRSQRRRLVGVRTRRDTARQGALFANEARQAPRVHIRDRHDLLAHEVLLERRIRPPTARAPRRLSDDEPGSPDLAGFHVFAVDAGIADLRIGQGDDLESVGGVGEDLLVARHRRIEYHLADGHARNADRMPAEQATVF